MTFDGYRQSLERILAVPAIAILAGALALSAGSALSAEPAAHVVTDFKGRTVTVPATVDRIAEQFPAHTAMDIMLGAGDRLVAIPRNVKTIPLLRKVYPRIADVPELFQNGGGVNIEELMALKPDVVSVGAAAKPFEAAGMPAVAMGFDSYETMTNAVLLAGEVYGGSAVDRAKAYVDYLNAKVELVKSRTGNLPADQKPSVLHIASYPPLVVDGGKSIIDQWITLGGGTDAASSVPGAHFRITFEQLLKWDPDVIVIETPGGDQGIMANSGLSVIDAFAKSPGWSDLKAVKTHRVYINPQGLYPWDRYGPEEALQIQWIAKTLHPDLFTDLDIRAETRGFYKTFFGYTLSDAELDTMFQSAN